MKTPPLPPLLKRSARLQAKRVYQFFSPAPATSQYLIFVTGHQRSGTNMFMNVLERHWHTDVYHETDPRAFSAYQMREQSVIRHLADRSRAQFVVIKSLCEMQRLRSLLDVFPRSKAVWLVRHYADVCNSMARQFSSTSAILKAMRDDRDAGGWRSENMSDRTFSILQSLVTDDIDEVSAAALQWYMRNILFFEQNLQEDDRVRLISYESLATNPAISFPDAFGFLGIPSRPSTFSHVFSSSVRRQYPPRIEPEIERLCASLFADLQGLCRADSTRNRADAFTAHTAMTQ